MKQERHDLFQKCLASEQTLSDTRRESELKDIKIESLQNVIAKREQQAAGPRNPSASKSKPAGKGKKELVARIDQLEREKRTI